MTEKPKKIASKGEYLRIRSVFGARLLAFVFIGMFMLVSGFIAVGLLLCLPFMALATLVGGMSVVAFGMVLLLIFSLAVMAFRAYKGMDSILSAAESMLPLTHANTGDLPAQGSLVRASIQPQVPQQAILLRPAVETQDSHEEQLLRPT